MSYSNNNNNSSKNSNAATGGGITFTGLLTIFFIVLKLTGVITWSWLWVLSPLWISVGLFILFLIIFVIIMPIASKD